MWQKVLTKAERSTSQEIVLSFADGTEFSGFKLVVGADGLRSKIRPLVHQNEPKFAGVMYLTTKISQDNTYYSKVEEIGGMGSHVVMGNGVHMFNSRHADGSYRIDCGFPTSEEFANSIGAKAFTCETAKEFLLSKERFGTFAPEMQDLIRKSEGPFYPWPMYYMPTESLSWMAQPDVTLIGDAAHVTTPYVGDGANCAMRDSILLTCALEKHGVTHEAIAAYEKEMMPFGIDLITRSNQSMPLFYHEGGPYAFKEVMSSADPLLGKMDHV